MATSNSNNETQRSAAFVADLLALPPTKLDDDVVVFTKSEIRQITKNGAVVFKRIAGITTAPMYWMLPFSVLFAAAAVRPEVGMQLANLGKARLEYAADQYDKCANGVDNPLMGTRYTKGVHLPKMMLDIIDGDAPDLMYARFINVMITAIVVDSVMVKPGYVPEDLFRHLYVVTEDHASTLLEWMQSCGIPVTYHK